MRNFGIFSVFLAVVFLVSSPMSEEAEAGKRKRHHNGSGGFNMAGCGLGSIAFPSGSKGSQIGASILNSIGFQSVAISVGSFNCREGGVVAVSKEKEMFVESNFADLSHDIAMGKGEYLDTLVSFYGCNSMGQKQFSNAMQKGYGQLLAQSSTPKGILKLARDTMKNPALKRMCSGS